MSKDLRQWESEQSDEAMQCRDLLHAWQPSTARRTGTGFERDLICPRCKTVKTQILDIDGYIVGAKFAYPEGYVRPAGSGRLTRDDKADLRVRNLKLMKPRRVK